MKSKIVFSLIIVSLCVVHGYYNETNSIQKRNGKFFFDTIFGIASAVSEADDASGDENTVKSCNCGKCCESWWYFTQIIKNLLLILNNENMTSWSLNFQGVFPKSTNKPVWKKMIASFMRKHKKWIKFL